MPACAGSRAAGVAPAATAASSPPFLSRPQILASDHIRGSSDSLYGLDLKHVAVKALRHDHQISVDVGRAQHAPVVGSLFSVEPEPEPGLFGMRLTPMSFCPATSWVVPAFRNHPAHGPPAPSSTHALLFT